MTSSISTRGRRRPTTARIPGKQLPREEESGPSTSIFPEASPSSSTPYLGAFEHTPATSHVAKTIPDPSTIHLEDPRIVLGISENQYYVIPGDQAPASWFEEQLKSRLWENFYPTLKEVPATQKRVWWTEFQRTYRWSARTDAEAKTTFNAVLAGRYRDIIYDLKNRLWLKGKSHPSFIHEDIWASFGRHWSSEGTCLVSKQAKSNRANPSGPSLSHTFGSQNFATHYQRQVAAYGDDVPMIDTFRATHMVQTLGGEAWADSKSQSAWNEYEARLAFDRASSKIDKMVNQDHMVGEVEQCTKRPKRNSLPGIREFRGQMICLGPHQRGASSSFLTTARDPTQLRAQLDHYTEKAHQANERAKRAEEMAAKAQEDIENLRQMFISIQSRVPPSPSPSFGFLHSPPTLAPP